MDKLDEEIAQMEATIQLLKARIMAFRVARNALAPINQLPADVLIEIFALVGCQDGEANHLLSIPNVAHMWRQIALSYPQLWATFDSSNFRSPDLWLSRSRSFPLTVRLGNNFIPGGDSPVLLQSYRIVELVFYPTPQISYWVGVLWSLFAFPSLKRLFIKSTRILDEIFTNTTLSLEVLVLDSCTLHSPHLFKFSSLTSLSLAHIHPRIPLNVFANILNDMIQLRTLSLLSTLALSDDPCGQISFPNLYLSQLWLRETPAIQRWMVEQDGLIRPQTRVHLSLMPAEQLNGLMALHHQLGARYDIQEISLNGPSNDLKIIPLAITYRSRTNHGEVELAIYCDNHTIISLLSNFQRESAHTHVHLFRVGCNKMNWGPLGTEDEESQIITFFSSLKNVRHIHLRGTLSSVEGFLLNSSLTQHGRNPNVLETLRIETPRSCRALFDNLFLTPFVRPRPFNTLILGCQTGSAAKHLRRYAEKVVVVGTEDFAQLDNPLARNQHELMDRPFKEYF